ncbi:hypothetical protein BsWGS_09721 [Bradybaena similaris]
MPGFNTSTRKEDLSLRLRTQNLKNARDQTKHLEEDNRKMEERLKELKTAMRREKELRERQGAGFWGRGQSNSGSLTNYASEVLQNKVMALPPEGQIKKVKILRDEPIGKPKQIGQPGTMKYIAQRKLTTGAMSRDKQKGPKCGQCEDRTATLSCIQCSEIYCPGCFAAFHLKGALKQHRSVPLSAAGPRVCMPASTSADILSPRAGQAASGTIPTQPYNEYEMNGSEAAGASSSKSPPQAAAPTLLHGEYDESQSAASFQAALMAWRQGEQPVAHPSTRLNQGKPTSSPAVAVDESIGTSEEVTVPDIKFKSTLSYTEKLLLKKHLRMKLAEVSPGIDSQSDGPRPGRQSTGIHQASEKMSARSSSQLHSQGSFSRAETLTDPNKHPTSSDPTNSFKDTERDMENRLSCSADEDGHVDFQSLFEVVALSRSPDKTGAGPGPSLSEVSIMELFPQGKPAIPDVSCGRPTYIVKEVSPLESWKTEHLQQKELWTPALITNGYTDFSQEDIRDVVHHDEDIPKLSQPTSKSSLLPTSTSSLDQGTRNCLIISELPSNDNSKSGQTNCDPIGYQYEEEVTDIEDIQNASSAEEQKTSKPPPRPTSAKSQTRRAMSRSKSSRASSRTASRAGMEGCLTKEPSEALKRVIQRMQSPEHSCSHQSPLESFFLVGVQEQQAAQQEDRVVTPFRERNKTLRIKSRLDGAKSARQEKEAIKISNRLYQMAPRSWHPDSGLSSAVPLSEIQLGETTLSFSYGKQMSGQGGVDWHSPSSHAVKNIPDGDHAPEPALLFGDELFVAEAAAAACKTPQIASGRLSSQHRQGDHHLVTSRNASQDQLPSTPQTMKILSGRRFHNITKPSGKGDILKELKITPVPPDSTPGHRLNPKISTSTLGRSKYHHNFAGSDQISSEKLKQNLSKSKRSKDEENLVHFRNSAELPEGTNSLTKSLPLKSKPHFSSVKQNQSPVKTITIVDQENEVKTMSRSVIEMSLEKQEMSDFRMNFHKMLRDQKVNSKSDRRPNSSVNVSTQGESSRHKKSARTQRPNSSSEPREKQQVSPKSGTDAVVSDMLKSRVQEDGWVNCETDFSHDYDDGDHLSARCLLLPDTENPNSDVKKSEIWETDIRPFSGTSMSSKSGHLQTKTMTVKGDRKNSSRPPSCRSVSAVSQRSGRTSRAIVIDGDDLSCYDSLDISAEQNMKDRQALEQLEWELASNTGRLTADGKISRMSHHDNDDLGSSTSVKHSTLSSESDYNVAAKLLEDERQAARKVENLELNGSISLYEIDEVKALS